MINIGTDCSGIEAPIQALKKLKIKYNHAFSSDIDKYARESIVENYNPSMLYDDMTKKRKLPKLDMYICGFPCQPFSMAGKRGGSDDSRGNIFLHCIKTIKQTQPTLFILENVKGILTVENGEYWKNIQKKIKSLKDYELYPMLLNTRDYGIPQNRERLFIIGMKKNKIKNPLQYPKQIKCKNIESYIDRKDRERDVYPPSIKEKTHIFKYTVFCNIDLLRKDAGKPNPKYSPTLMASQTLWCIPMHRRANIKEWLSLQGFPINFKQVVSDTQMKKQIGNSMSVNVLVHLFKQCFLSLGWV